MAVAVKTISGLAYASVKTVNGLAVASMKSYRGVDTTTAGFSYSSVVFDGTNDFLLRGGDPVPDGKKGLFSAWIKMGSGTSDATTYYFMGNTGNAFYVRRFSSGVFQFSTAGGVLNSSIVIDKAGGWYHIMASWDAAVGASARLYINGTSRLNSITLTDNTTDYASGDWKIGDLVGGSSKWNGLVSELYFTDEYLDLSVSGNRDKFFNSGTSKPVDLGVDGSTPTGTQPRIYLHNDFATWHTNLGSGGNFTVTGALGDGGADKP